MMRGEKARRNMELDYTEIGKRIARRRRELGLKQSELSERVNNSNTYMSSIERAISIPSTEVIMRLAIALETTPDTFLVGSAHFADEKWRDISEKLRLLNGRQLEFIGKLIDLIAEQSEL